MDFCFLIIFSFSFIHSIFINLGYEPNERPNYPPHRPDYPPEDPQQPGQIEPYKVAIGDKTEMHCNIENQNKPTSWRRVDGRPLPRGSHLYGGILVIDVTTHDAAGYYECTVREQDSEIPVVRTEIVVIGKSFFEMFVTIN